MASEDVTFGQIELSAVYEMANIGLGHATTALSELTGHSFWMCVPSVEQLAVKQVPTLIGNKEDIVATVLMPFEGDVSGYVAFIFPWKSALRIWTLLLGSAPESVESIGELEASAMLEVGNILNSSFLNAISDMTGLTMHATPPLVAIESCGAISESIVTEAESHSAVALSIETQLTEADGETSGYFLCIPSVDGLRLLFRRLGIQEAA